MTEDQKDECIICGEEIPEGTAQCPECGTHLAFCTNTECCCSFPADAEYCPFCGEKNQAAALIKPPEDDEEPEDSPADQAPPEEPQHNGTEDHRQNNTMMQPSGKTPEQQQAGTSGTEQQLPAELTQLLQLSGADADADINPADLIETLQGMMQQSGAEAGGLQNMDDMLPAVPQPQTPAQPPIMGSQMDVSMTGVPVMIEHKTAGSYSLGKQGLVKLRAEGVAVAEECHVSISLESSLFPKTVHLRADIDAGEQHEWKAVRFVPKIAGAEEIALVLEVQTSDGKSLGRWWGDLTIEVKGENTDGSREDIRAGGDVFILGGQQPPQMPGMPDLGTDMATWQPIDLKEDRAFQKRLRKICPDNLAQAPSMTDIQDRIPGNGAFQACVHFQLMDRPVCSTLVRIGDSSNFGRGERPDIHWRIKPEPYTHHSYGLLSRRHCELAIDNGQAWVKDFSTNGVKLNAEQVDASKRALVADGDEINLGGAITFKGNLYGKDGQVHAVLLERTDGLQDKLQYLLMDNTVAIPLPVGNGQKDPVWMAWVTGEDNSAALAVRGTGCEMWTTVERDEVGEIDGIGKISWTRIESPGDQDDYLQDKELF